MARTEKMLVIIPPLMLSIIAYLKVTAIKISAAIPPAPLITKI